MSTPKAPAPAKLVMSVFMKEKTVLESVFPRLEAVGGPVDMISPWLDFDFTDYYYREMGEPLFRRLIAFISRLWNRMPWLRSNLTPTGLKRTAWTGDNRTINIDPGYLLSSRFILATGKEYSHRIYIGRKIYADLTLMYTKKGFKTLEWTYPDYASDAVLKFLTQVRQKYLADIRAIKG